jgi:hypothetical protein
VTVKWIVSEEVTEDNVRCILDGCHGILVRAASVTAGSRV